MQGEVIDSPTCSVYRGRGETPQSYVLPALIAGPADPRISATSVPLHRIMSRNLIVARPDLDIRMVVRLIMDRHIGCIPVIDERQRPIGMITKLDLLDQVDAAMTALDDDHPLPQDLQARCADEVMMPLAFTLSEYATIAHAAAMMMSEDTHHVIIVSANDEIAGIVSSRDIVGWLLRSDER